MQEKVLNSVEQSAREAIQKVRDKSMATGFYTALHIVKDIVDDTKLPASVRLEKIHQFINKTLPVLEINRDKN